MSYITVHGRTAKQKGEPVNLEVGVREQCNQKQKSELQILYCFISFLCSVPIGVFVQGDLEYNHFCEQIGSKCNQSHGRHNVQAIKTIAASLDIPVIANGDIKTLGRTFQIFSNIYDIFQYSQIFWTFTNISNIH